MLVQIAEAPKEGRNKDNTPFPLLSADLAFSPQVVQQVKGAPQAYLSFIAYDSTGSYISSDYQLLTSEARDSWQQLKLEYTAGQDGYVEVFTANESGQDAYFDDLLLTTHAAMQVQENHYDPWGLNLVGIESQGSPDHKFQYNGKEKQEEFGLHWNDYGARFYDPQLGRWHAVDLVADEPAQLNKSPYAAFWNNPIRNNDPDGQFPVETIWDIGNLIYDVGAAIYNHIDGNHKAARSNWADAGMDAGATLIPYVPAGASKLVKGGVVVAEAIDKANDVRKITKAKWGNINSYGDKKQTAIEHIQKSHFFDSRKGKATSRFSESNSEISKVKDLTNEAMSKGKHSGTEGNYSVTHTFDKVIGTDSKGRKTKTLVIYLDKVGNVLNSYPIPK